MIEVIIFSLMVVALLLWLPSKIALEWWREPRCVDGTRNHKRRLRLIGGEGPMQGVARGYESVECQRCGLESSRTYVY